MNYLFDLKLACSVRLSAASLPDAQRQLRGLLECADIDLGVTEDGNPVLALGSLADDPILVEVTS